MKGRINIVTAIVLYSILSCSNISAQNNNPFVTNVTERTKITVRHKSVSWKRSVLKIEYKKCVATYSCSKTKTSTSFDIVERRSTHYDMSDGLTKIYMDIVSRRAMIQYWQDDKYKIKWASIKKVN